jgi:hypothetical protein
MRTNNRSCNQVMLAFTGGEEFPALAIQRGLSGFVHPSEASPRSKEHSQPALDQIFNTIAVTSIRYGFCLHQLWKIRGMCKWTGTDISPGSHTYNYSIPTQFTLPTLL